VTIWDYETPDGYTVTYRINGDRTLTILDHPDERWRNIVVRDKLWTAKEAETELGLPEGTVDNWVHRSQITPATSGWPRKFWSHHIIECRHAGKKQRKQSRDSGGRFRSRPEPVLDFLT
jgi:hypothetical protein